jgi:hypothetical protein
MKKTQEQIEAEITEKRAIINGNLDLLKQGDWIARKGYKELAEIIHAKFPDEAMPIYNKYLAHETEAQRLRDENNVLEEEIAELEQQL